MKNSLKINRIFANEQQKAVVLFGVALTGMICVSVLALALILPFFRAPLGPPLNLPTPTFLTGLVPVAPLQPPSGEDSAQPTVQPEENATQPADVATQPAEEDPISPGEPLCGNQDSLTFLLVGIDYRRDGYRYGLADVIRVVRVDYTAPRVNVVSLPRAMLVELDQNWFRVEGPALLNQSYFFGSPGMQKYLGEGDGAGALAHVLQDNFGVTSDHYLVMNFDAFVRFIDALGGIEVDLPEEIKGTKDKILFPAGVQWLDGERALQLARERKKYSDLVRIDNQTLILQAIFKRVKDPAVLVRLPDVIDSLWGAVVTDVSPLQIADAVCLLTKLEGDDLYFFAPPGDTMQYDKEYIPSLKREMEIFYWDDAFTRWLQESLAAGME